MNLARINKLLTRGLLAVAAASVSMFVVTAAYQGGGLDRGPDGAIALPKFGVGVLSNRRLSEQRIADDARYLSCDELEGRGITTRGIDLAAQHIADRFRESGLNCGHFDGTPFQKFRISRRLGLGVTNECQLHIPRDQKKRLRLGDDFRPLSLSGSGAFDLPLVFAGYGITDQAIGYDDYAGIDVRGKAVVLLRHEPRRTLGQNGGRNAGQNAAQFKANSKHAYLASKVENAIRHGAAAVVFCNDRYAIRRRSPGGNGIESDETSLAADDFLLPFDIRPRGKQYEIPVMHWEREPINMALDLSIGKTLLELERAIDEDFKPRSQLIGAWRITGEVSVGAKGKMLKNVIATRDTTGPLSKETVVVGAHYDHLGRGGSGTLAPWTVAIHNGADDNASGTAVMLEVARQIAGRKERLARGVLFIAFSAEESGLIGSERYVGKPLVPLAKTVAMVNLDMVGRLRNDRLLVGGLDSADEFPEWVSRFGRRHGLRATPHSGGFGASDHMTFQYQGVPALHFFTGLHDDYHRPTDDFEKLNRPGMQRIAAMVTDLVVELANSPSRPGRHRDRQIAKSAPRDRPIGIRRTGSRPFLGVTADANRSGERGFPIGRVWGPSAAERAGLRVGDVITRFGLAEIISSSDLAEAVRRLSVGDRTDVVIRRGMIELEIQVTLEGR